MTSKMVQGHSDVGLREELKNIWNETTPVWRHVCVHTFGYCYYDVHDKNVYVKIRMRQYDGTALQNSESYHVSGFTSGSFHAVSTVCLLRTMLKDA